MDQNILQELNKNENCKALLDYLVENGKIDPGSIQDYMDMNKRDMVRKVHPYAIAQGKGKDTRWYTRISEETKGGAKKKVARNTEKELFDFLYQYYYGDTKPIGKLTLPEIYPEWLDYRSNTGVDSCTVRRNDSDYKRFYVNEPLSEALMATPLADLHKHDLEKWAYALIKAHRLNYKAYTNMAFILRDTMRYLVDQEVLEESPFDHIKINSKCFRKDPKKKAETQIYFNDEKKKIIALAEQRAKETNDEIYYAVAILFQTGTRPGECLSLSFSDFDREQSCVHLHASFKAKESRRKDGTWKPRRYENMDYLKQNAEPRDVLVADDCFVLVEKIRQLQEKNGLYHDGYLFHSITPSNLGNKVRRLCNELGIIIRSPHKMRKTYVSTLVNGQFDLDFVRAQVGHKEIQTTLNSYTYSTTRPEKQIQKLNEVL